MEKLKNNIEKLCSFYVSDWHLVTMILPYINQKLYEKANIITILENNIEDNIKTLISKLNLKNEEKVLKINWGITDKEIIETKIEDIKNNKNTSNIIFINGSKDYIDWANEIVKEKIKDAKIKIVNCYEVTDFNERIKEILNSHDKVLNTSGERNIEDLFSGYQKKMA